VIVTKYKAIVFDLDDTLFDTWEKCTKPASLESCEAMIKAGLNCTPEEGIAERERAYKRNPRKDPYENLVNRFGLRADSQPPTVVTEAGRVAFQSRNVEPDIKLFPGVQRTLADLKTKYLLFLVTSGAPATQKQKVSLLRIKDFFTHIFYVDTLKKQRKSTAFLEIMDHTSISSEQVICVGDRIDREIAEGKQVGFVTVLLEREHNLHFEPENPIEVPDFKISSISELIPKLKL
jgi:putative hydrolase of the HAD superfamily